MSKTDFLQRQLELARAELQRWRPGLERTGRVYRTFLVMASDEWWTFAATRWTWDAGLLLAAILFGALLGGVPGALVGIVFVLLGSFALTLVRAPVRAIDFVNYKRRVAIREVEEREDREEVGAERGGAGTPPSSSPSPSKRAPSVADRLPPDSRLGLAMQTLVLPPSAPPAAPEAAAPARPGASTHLERVRGMLADGLKERAVLLARRTAGPEAAREASAAMSKWLGKYLTLLQRTLADAAKRDRMQRLLSLAGEDLEKQARVDPAVLEAELRALADADVRTDFQPRTWNFDDWSVL